MIPKQLSPSFDWKIFEVKLFNPWSFLFLPHASLWIFLLFVGFFSNQFWPYLLFLLLSSIQAVARRCVPLSPSSVHDVEHWTTMMFTTMLILNAKTVLSGEPSQGGSLVCSGFCGENLSYSDWVVHYFLFLSFCAVVVYSFGSSCPQCPLFCSCPAPAVVFRTIIISCLGSNQQKKKQEKKKRNLFILWTFFTMNAPIK